jgi:hypothetical protein
MANGKLLENDPFVGKLYHFAINHASGLHLNKKANYLTNQVKICNCVTRTLFINKKKLKNSQICIPYHTYYRPAKKNWYSMLLLFQN